MTMSSAPREPVLAGLRLTADDYLALGETEHRYELVDGVVMMSPSPKPVHWRIIREFIRQLETSESDVDLYAEIDVFFDLHHVYRPDLSVYAPGRLSEMPDRLDVPPDLVVEVVSPTSRTMDLVTKRDDYERFGVGEYWAVDITADRVRCWRRDDAGRFAESAADSGEVECGSIPGLRVDVGRIRAIWKK